MMLKKNALCGSVCARTEFGNKKVLVRYRKHRDGEGETETYLSFSCIFFSFDSERWALVQKRRQKDGRKKKIRRRRR